jgi:hypothetical protein
LNFIGRRVDALELRHCEGLGASDVPATERCSHSVSFPGS